MRYKNAYSGSEIADDLMAVGAAGGRGFSVGHLSRVQRAAMAQQQLIAQHGAQGDDLRRQDAQLLADAHARLQAGMSPSEAQALRHEFMSARGPLLDSIESHDKARALAEIQHAKLTQHGLPDAYESKRTSGRVAANALMPTPGADNRGLGHIAAMALATGGLQHAATAGLLHVSPNASPLSTAAASAGGALAGRALVRGYDAYQDRMAPKTASISTGFWEDVAQGAFRLRGW